MKLGRTLDWFGPVRVLGRLGIMRIIGWDRKRLVGLEEKG